MIKSDHNPQNIRQEYLNQILRTTPTSESWNLWLQKTGELPPDFDQMPACLGLPHPLMFQGKQINTIDEWQKKKTWLKKQFDHWVFGQMPPPPKNWHAERIKATSITGGEDQIIRLHLSAGGEAHLSCEFLIPEGKGPHPVFMTQSNHRAWGLIAFQRGYLSVLYNACDAADDSESFTRIYPDADWSVITRRAWAASRVIDFLETFPKADPTKIFLTGHSRNGKQALITAAYDERVLGVISCSSGAIGVCPTRLFGEGNFGEGLELITRRFPTWFHPRLRFFVGREQYLPLDMHDLICLSAPRHCFISTAINDVVESVLAVQHAYLATQTIYQLYQRPQNLQLHWRTGGHGTNAETIQQYLDWCDCIINNQTSQLPQDFILPMDVNFYQTALQTFTETVPGSSHLNEKIPSISDSTKIRFETSQKILKLLGDPPPSAENPGETYGVEEPFIAQLLFRSTPPAQILKKQLVFGEFITADVYCPSDPGVDEQNLPCVLWLPPLSISHGYHAGYFYGEQFYIRLAKQGFKVYCFDPIGMGNRIMEAKSFYSRYPHWSLFGKMLHDAQQAIDLIKQQSRLPKNNIFLTGFGFGALLGLHLTALDSHICGSALIGFPPLTQIFINNLSAHKQPLTLIPDNRLNDHLPYQISDLIACCVPRPMLFIEPKHKHTSHFDSRTFLNQAEETYQTSITQNNLTILETEDYHHFSPIFQDWVIEWLTQKNK